MQISQEWQWRFEPEQEQLMIELGDGLTHPSPYKNSRLIPIHKAFHEPLSLEDALLFQEFTELLEQGIELSPTDVLQAGLNCLIIEKYGRPQMPQSWYFQTAQEGYEYSVENPPKLGEVVELNSGLATAKCAITHIDSEFVECMVLGTEFPLSDIKTLNQFDVIKVMFNRIQSLHNNSQHDHHQKHA